MCPNIASEREPFRFCEYYLMAVAQMCTHTHTYWCDENREESFRLSTDAHKIWPRREKSHKKWNWRNAFNKLWNICEHRLEVVRWRSDDGPHIAGASIHTQTPHTVYKYILCVLLKRNPNTVSVSFHSILTFSLSLCKNRFAYGERCWLCFAAGTSCWISSQLTQSHIHSMCRLATIFAFNCTFSI